MQDFAQGIERVNIIGFLNDSIKDLKNSNW